MRHTYGGAAGKTARRPVKKHPNREDNSCTSRSPLTCTRLQGSLRNRRGWKRYSRRRACSSRAARTTSPARSTPPRPRVFLAPTLGHWPLSTKEPRTTRAAVVAPPPPQPLWRSCAGCLQQPRHPLALLIAAPVAPVCPPQRAPSIFLCVVWVNTRVERVQVIKLAFPHNGKQT